MLLAAVGLPAEKFGGVRPFSLGSLRPGGASWLLHVSENSELVRRRGRRLSTRVMEIYLQEVLVATFVKKLEPSVRAKLKKLAQGLRGQILEAWCANTSLALAAVWRNWA